MTEPGNLRVLVLLAVVAAVVGFAYQGTRGLWASTEARYAECAREMLETGRWLEPTLDYQPHWTKPPPSYWALAGGMALLGRNEWGLRLAAAVAFVLTVLAVALLGAAMWDARAGLVAGLIYVTSPFAVAGGNVISTDAFLTLWFVLTILCYWRAVRAASQRAQALWVAVMWLCAGLGFGIKGPVALLAFLPILVFQLVLKRRGRARPRLFSPLGIPLFLVVSLWWYLWVVLTHEGMLGHFLGYEVLGRVATSEAGRDYNPFTTYLPVLAFGALPWVFWWLPVWRNRRLWPRLVEAVGSSRREAAGGPLRFCRAAFKRLVAWIGCWDEGLLFSALWLLPPLAVFFVARSRLPLYVLPLFPAVVLATAYVFVWYHGDRLLLRRGSTSSPPPSTRLGTVSLSNRRAASRGCLVLALCLAVVIVAAKGFISHLPSTYDVRLPLAGPGAPGLARTLSTGDLKPVALAALRQDDGDTGFLLADRRESYALQFYLDGRVERFSTSDEPWARRPLAAVMHELASAPRHRRYVIIARVGNAALARVLDCVGLARAVAPAAGNYELLIVERRPAAASRV